GLGAGGAVVSRLPEEVYCRVLPPVAGAARDAQRRRGQPDSGHFPRHAVDDRELVLAGFDMGRFSWIFGVGGRAEGIFPLPITCSVADTCRPLSELFMPWICIIPQEGHANEQEDPILHGRLGRSSRRRAVHGAVRLLRGRLPQAVRLTHGSGGT